MLALLVITSAPLLAVSMPVLCFAVLEGKAHVHAQQVSSAKCVYRIKHELCCREQA